MAEKKQLTKFAREQLGHYVYALRNPIDKTIFYVGKGKGDRVLAHANGVIDGLEHQNESEDSLKNDVIKQILDAGLEVESYIVQHGLADDDQAFATESAIYGTLKLLAEDLSHAQFALTNKVAPPQFNSKGLRTIQQVLADYGQPADTRLIPHNSILIKPTLSGTWHPSMGRELVWEATRGWWRINRNRLAHTRYVIAIPNFVIRGVWEVNPSDWREQRRGDRGWSDILAKRRLGKERTPRLGFDCNIDLTESRFEGLLNTSIEEHFSRHAKQSNFYYLDDFRVRESAKKGERPFWNVSLT